MQAIAVASSTNYPAQTFFELHRKLGWLDNVPLQVRIDSHDAGEVEQSRARGQFSLIHNAPDLAYLHLTGFAVYHSIAMKFSECGWANKSHESK
jgi:hypothetical protein